MIAEKKEVKVIMPTKGIYKDKLLRVAAYCRVSTDKYDQVNSFIAQVKYYNDFIKQNNSMILVDIYADEGITGTCISKRDEFKRMIKDAKAGKIDRVYVKSVSRFARNSLECIENIRILKEYGTSVIFENDKIDTETMNSEMILYIKSAFAQCEVLASSKRVSTAARMKMESGEYTLATPPYGYTVNNNVLVPIPECKPIIQRIFNDYLSGKGVGTITKKLNDENCGKKKWSVSSVQYILSNESYVGDMLLQKKFTPEVLPFKKIKNNGELPQYYITNTHEGIVTRETFDKVSKKLKYNIEKKRRNANNKDRLFSKKIRCGDCGYTYKHKLKNNVDYWVCSLNGIAGKKCKSFNVKETDIKTAFVRMFNKLVIYKNEIIDFPLNQLISVKSKISNKNSDINEIDEEIAALCNRNSMIARLKNQEIIDDISYAEQINEIKQRLAELRQKRTKLISEDDEESAIEELRNLKSVVESYEGFMFLFDETVFEKIVRSVIIGNNTEILFQLNCGLKLKEAI